MDELKPCPVTVVDLSFIPMQCVICEAEWDEPRSAKSYGVARYEDEVVPDDYKGEWGGAPVCVTCFHVERGLHASSPSRFIPFSEIRAIVAWNRRAKEQG